MLSDDDRALLDLEARGWIHEGVKIGAMGLELGMQPNRYYQRLNALIDDPDALAYSPMLVNRLRRLRERARHRQ